MKYQIMLGILFTLLSARKKSAGALAAKYHCSVRSVYRYVEELIVAGIPIDVGRGANGGIWISDAYKLPKGFMTKEEYARTVEAMLAMLEQTGDETLRAALEKITSGMKREKSDAALSGNILVDSGTWGDERRFSEKLAITDRAISEREALEIDYVDREGETSKRKILPHLLVYKQNIWYVYAFCNTRNAFRLFKLGRMRSILQTGETFERLDFSRDEIPLSFWRDDENDLDVRLQIAPEKRSVFGRRHAAGRRRADRKDPVGGRGADRTRAARAENARSNGIGTHCGAISGIKGHSGANIAYHF